jgi:hypothetical protein
MPYTSTVTYAQGPKATVEVEGHHRARRGLHDVIDPEYLTIVATHPDHEEGDGDHITFHTRSDFEDFQRSLILAARDIGWLATACASEPEPVEAEPVNAQQLRRQAMAANALADALDEAVAEGVISS